MVDGTARAVGEHERLAPGVQEVQDAGEGVLAAGDQRDAVVRGEGRAALARRRRRCGLKLEVQAQLVVGEVGPDALKLDAVGFPVGRVADGHPCLDRAAPVHVTLAALAGHIDREQVAEDLDPVLLARVELGGQPSGELVNAQREVALAVQCVAAADLADRGHAGGGAVVDDHRVAPHRPGPGSWRPRAKASEISGRQL